MKISKDLYKLARQDDIRRHAYEFSAIPGMLQSYCLMA